MRTPVGLAGLAALAIGFALLAPTVAVGDMAPPAHMQITEREPGLYAVQWRVPKALPPRAVPTPALPETCVLIGEPEITDQPAAWLINGQWRCESTLAGQEIGMRYPFPDLALTTVVRVDLLSGDRFAHLLTPEELAWRLPEGTAALDVVLEAQRAVLSGARHVLGSWLHLTFLLVVGLLAGSSAGGSPGGGDRADVAGGAVGPSRPLRIVSAFSLAQIAAVLAAGAGQTLGPGTSVSIGTIPAELGFAIGVALLARQALEPVDKRRRLEALAGAAGLVHGFGIVSFLTADLGEEAAGLISQLLAVLGMDAIHLVGAFGATAIVGMIASHARTARFRGAVVYWLGATAMSLALALALQGGAATADAVEESLQTPPGSAGSSGMGGSRRLAPSTVDATIQSFLSIEPFEVRHEVMIRLASLEVVLHAAGRGEDFRLDPDGTIEIEDQSMVADRLATLLVNAEIFIDGYQTDGIVRRVDYMLVDATGALPRPNPVPEPVAEAVVGVIVAYPAGGMPDEVVLRWTDFRGNEEAIPATVIDPEAVSSQTLTAEQPSLTWENVLIEDPIPTVDAVEVEPTRIPVPLASLPLFLIAVVLIRRGVRDGRSSGGLARARWVAGARVVLALAILVGPIAQTSFALPGSAGRTPSERQARRILAGLLPNIYRALEFREEGLIYDRLSVSVTGETLTEVYLEQRQALEMEERGGAQARVESVEVLEAGEIESTESGFSARATWTVGGMVTHFGHRHFRQNRYDARIGVVPVSGTWKIQTIEVLEQERVR